MVARGASCMNLALSVAESQLLDRALASARDTRFVSVDRGILQESGATFASEFTNASAAIVADNRTFEAAGKEVAQGLRRAGVHTVEHAVLGPDVSAEYAWVEWLRERLGATQAIPIAVGSGTINDLTKLVAHQLGRPYLVVATAASMDGYAAQGASITLRGSKQTFDCPAPRVILVDLDVLARAPREMSAWGYADLLAKSVAGADWILAGAAGEERIDRSIWNMVQGSLPSLVSDPRGIATVDPAALRRLVVGLLASGFAMQAARSSRPASGAEHQFSHLWDMQHHTHLGIPPSHGFKVAIGTLASLGLYEFLLRQNFDHLSVDTAVASWPSLFQVEAGITRLFGSGELAGKAAEETRAKYLAPEALRSQLERLRDRWPVLREQLREHLLRFRDVRAMLHNAGCPTEPEQIGITRDRLRASYEQAYYIRRRFTVLDFAMRFGVFDPAVCTLFSAGGAWSHSSSTAVPNWEPRG